MRFFLIFLGIICQPFFTEAQIFNSKKTIFNNHLSSYDVYAVDINGDGLKDIISSSHRNSKIVWHQNLGNLKFKDYLVHKVPTSEKLGNSPNGTRGINAADIDNDGDVDILESSYAPDSGKIAWYENDGSQNFTQHIIDSKGFGDRFSDVHAADINGDSHLDILGAQTSGNNIFWYENDGNPDPSFSKYKVGNIDGPLGVYAADIDNDGDNDVVAAAWRGNKVIWYENNGKSKPTFKKHVIDKQCLKATQVHVIDLNKDGANDILVACRASDQIIYYKNNGQKNPTFKKNIINSNGVEDVFAADINQDNNLDIISANKFGGILSWYENSGGKNPSFTEHVLNPIKGSYPKRVHAADFNNNGVKSLVSAEDYSFTSLYINCLNIDTINRVSCKNYEVPSKDTIFSNSGFYTDTLQGSDGCDSLIKINLTINKPSFDTINPVACEDFIAPSKDTVYTKTGVYSDTLVNARCCDSIVTINLKISKNTYDTIKTSACKSYTVPSGDETYTSSGTYMDTLTNSQGCDSLITMNLTINQPSKANLSINTCDSLTLPSGEQTVTTPGTYYDTLTNTAGCDSILTINVAFNKTSYDTFSTTTCDEYTAPSGQITWTTSGTYNDTLTKAQGCDSILTIDLTLHNTTRNTIDTTICGSYRVPSGDETYNVSGKYMDTIPNKNGCDSIITVKLSKVNLDTTIKQVSGRLRAQQEGAQYQWLDCNKNYARIDGSDERSFKPFANGQYAVVINKKGCRDTSNCYQVQNVGITSKGSKAGFEIYPNPTADQLTIVQKHSGKPENFSLETLTGQSLKTGKLSGTKTLDISNLSPGVYLLEVKGEEAVKTKKVVIE